MAAIACSDVCENRNRPMNQKLSTPARVGRFWQGACAG